MTKKRIHLDFETRSCAELKKVGAYLYAAHPTTEILCMAYGPVEHGDLGLWTRGDPFPHFLDKILKSGEDFEFVAHNASFEFLIWNFTAAKRYGWPRINIKYFDCTMVRAYSMGLPGTLAGAAAAAGISQQKDMEGHRVMLQMCKPRRYEGETPIFYEDEKRYNKLYHYCFQDVRTEMELDKRLLKLTENEKALWLLDQKINNVGVFLDSEACQKAIEIVHKEMAQYNKAIKKKTDGHVKTVNSHIALKKWVNAKLKKEKLPLIESTDKAAVKELLDDVAVPEYIKEVFYIRQSAGKSSVYKLKAMENSKSPKDSRVRGCFQYYGAASTGRWAGRRIQLQNLKRPEIKQNEIDDIMKRLKKSDPEVAKAYLNFYYKGAIGTLASCTRAMLRAAPGKSLIAADFASIEARVLAWLAGEESVLNVFRGHGKIYEHTACQIFNIYKGVDAVTKNQRLIGKVASLALGYQGGVGAFQLMAKSFFLKIADTKADKIKLLWRAKHQRIVKFWYALEACAIAAVKHPGRVYTTSSSPKGREVKFKMVGSFLFCRLPSGRNIVYPYPKVGMSKTPWGDMKEALSYKGVDTVTGKWEVKKAYGGLIAENVTQAVSRDLLAHALLNFESKGLKIIMHVHDEIVIEKDKTDKTFNTRDAENLMKQLPSWAKGLPVDAEGWEGERYRK